MRAFPHYETFDDVTCPTGNGAERETKCDSEDHWLFRERGAKKLSRRSCSVKSEVFIARELPVPGDSLRQFAFWWSRCCESWIPVAFY
jgi:hypothetical protein